MFFNYLKLKLILNIMIIEIKLLESELELTKIVLEILNLLFLLAAGIIGGLWAYTKYVLERGIIPPVELALECDVLGSQDNWRVIEILLRLKNVGISTLVAENICVRLRYLDKKDGIPILVPDICQPIYGRILFPHVYTREVVSNDPNVPSEVKILDYDTFVQSGVEQIYTLVAAVPDSATFVLLKAEFSYAQSPSKFQEYILRISRRLGLIQYSLTKIKKPHTIERAFCVKQD